MKRIIIFFIAIGMILVFPTSCFKEYLDKAPESGLSKADVFTKYTNFMNFFDVVYNGTKRYGSNWRNFNIRNAYPLYFNFWDQKYTWESLTDMSDGGRYMEGQTFKSGQVSAFINKFTYDGDRRPVLESMFTCIRVCNLTLENIDMLQNASERDKDDLIGQAHFVRAFCHFELFRIWGRMPYMTKALTANDTWDIPRLSNHETLIRIAADMDSAAMFFLKAGKMRRDAGPGQIGHLNDANQFRPNGVAAKAFKARALLYAASPLNNELGQQDWEEAAKANWEAIQVAKQYAFDLLPAARYKENYIGTTYTNEQLWGWYAGTKAYNNGDLAGLVNGVFGASKSSFSGECPTQNFVDRFETRWGEPLDTQADRNAATQAGHYREQDPYLNRDPRFYIDVIYNQSPIVGYNKAEIWYEMKNGVANYSELLDQTTLGITRTGYYQRKRWGDQSTKNRTSPQYTDPLIRLGELYLNYAEAANEAYGPNGLAPGSGLTAIQALNVIRARIGMPDVLGNFTSGKDVFRKRVKNERIIELCFEGHYYFDIRRWMDAPQVYSSLLYGMDIEKVPVSSTYPLGFRHLRVALTSDRQPRWKEAMYYLPFNNEDNYKMKKFVPNEVW